MLMLLHLGIFQKLFLSYCFSNNLSSTSTTHLHWYQKVVVLVVLLSVAALLLVSRTALADNCLSIDLWEVATCLVLLGMFIFIKAFFACTCVSLRPSSTQFLMTRLCLQACFETPCDPVISGCVLPFIALSFWENSYSTSILRADMPVGVRPRVRNRCWVRCWLEKGFPPPWWLWRGCPSLECPRHIDFWSSSTAVATVVFVWTASAGAAGNLLRFLGTRDLFWLEWETSHHDVLCCGLVG